MMKKIDLSIPAKVKYIGSEGNPKFTVNQIYDAYFIEYWVGERKSLHVKGNDGKITDFNELADFAVLEDKGNVLNFYEARVKCVSDKYQDRVCGLTKGKEYPVIGRDKDGMYLVMDNSYCCYFYPANFFEIIDDEYGLLKERSVYYSYYGGKNR